MGEGDEIWLKLVEMELKKADSHPAGPSGIASGEGKLILQATSELRYAHPDSVNAWFWNQGIPRFSELKCMNKMQVSGEIRCP